MYIDPSANLLDLGDEQSAIGLGLQFNGVAYPPDGLISELIGESLVPGTDLEGRLVVVTQLPGTFLADGVLQPDEGVALGLGYTSVDADIRLDGDLKRTLILHIGTGTDGDLMIQVDFFFLSLL